MALVKCYPLQSRQPTRCGLKGSFSVGVLDAAEANQPVCCMQNDHCALAGGQTMHDRGKFARGSTALGICSHLLKTSACRRRSR